MDNVDILRMQAMLESADRIPDPQDRSLVSQLFGAFRALAATNRECKFRSAYDMLPPNFANFGGKGA